MPNGSRHHSIHKPGSRWLLAVCYLLLSCGSLLGCARDLGRGAAQGAVGEFERFLDKPETQQRINRLIDSTAVAVSASYQSRLEPKVNATWASVLDDGRGFLADGKGTLRDAEADLSNQLDHSLSASLERLLRHNLSVAGEEGRNQVALLSTQIERTFQERLSQSLSRAMGATVDTMVTHLAIGMRTQIAPAAALAAKKAVNESVKEASRQAQKTPMWKWAVVLAIGIIAGLAGVILYKIIRDRNQSRLALDLITREIDRTGNEELKSTIKKRAENKRVEPWLSGFLSARKPGA